MKKILENFVILIVAIALGFLFYLVADNNSCGLKGTDLLGRKCEKVEPVK
jgi:hypothetical protein